MIYDLLLEKDLEKEIRNAHFIIIWHFLSNLWKEISGISTFKLYFILFTI